MPDTVIKSDSSIHKQLTNVGAWFSSDMTSSNYILFENGISPKITTVFCFRSENYDKALRLLCDKLNKYGTVKTVNYDHDLDRFEFELVDYETQILHYFYLESIDKYLEEI